MKLTGKELRALQWVDGLTIMPPLDRDMWINLTERGLIHVDEKARATLTERGRHRMLMEEAAPL